MGNFNDTLTGNLKSEIDRLSQYTKDLEAQATSLNIDNLRVNTFWNDRMDLVREVLLASIRDEEEPLAIVNSIADILDISLLREISVTFNVAVEATMLVPSDFDIADFDVTNVSMEPWNSEVDDFVVQSFEIDNVEEA